MSPARRMVAGHQDDMKTPQRAPRPSATKATLSSRPPTARRKGLPPTLTMWHRDLGLAAPHGADRVSAVHRPACGSPDRLGRCSREPYFCPRPSTRGSKSTLVHKASALRTRHLQHVVTAGPWRKPALKACFRGHRPTVSLGSRSCVSTAVVFAGRATRRLTETGGPWPRFSATFSR